MNALRNYLKLSIGEPFRIYFPLGMLLGLVGVALWPLYFGGVTETYPLAAHFRFMIQGFLGSFVFGFLFTAGPRLLKCPRPPAILVYGFLALTAAEALATAAAKFLASDVFFLVQMIAAFVAVGVGFVKRRDLPPPGFLLGLAGLIAALLGSGLLLLESLGSTDAVRYPLTRILLIQAFPALPIVGIGAFFFPRLSGGPNTHDLPESRTPTTAWLRHALRALASLVAFALSIPLELNGNVASAYLLRAASLGVFLYFETPIFRPTKLKGSQKLHLILCSAAMVASFAAIAAFPAQRTAWLHAFFIVGVTGSIVLVATRVILGHSGNFLLAMRSKKPLLWAISILLLAGSIRVLADYAPSVRAVPYLFAATLWLAVGVVWFAQVAPKARIPDPDDT